MYPVFRYKWQLYLFISFIGLLAVSPFLNKPDWFDRRVLYSTFELYPREIPNNTDIYFSEKNIDILFLGSSMTLQSNDLFTLKHAFVERYGYIPVIQKVYHAHTGLDIDYVLLKDILSRSKVKLLIFETHMRMYKIKAIRIFCHFYGITNNIMRYSMQNG